MKRNFPSALLPLTAMGLLVAACGTGGDASRRDVTVFAAASLTESFEEMAAAFTEEHRGVDVTLNFASSSDLVTQINEGAPADVYAAADQENMTMLTDAGNNAGDPTVFAKNALQIAVERGNPLGIGGLPDLQDPDLIIVTCDPEVPIGAYSAEVFENAGVTVEADSFEEDVKAVASKVELGEADAGVVYATDVIASDGGIDGVEIPADVNVTPEYPIAVTAEASNAGGGEAFVEFVLGDDGQEILQRHGFSGP